MHTLRVVGVAFVVLLVLVRRVLVMVVIVEIRWTMAFESSRRRRRSRRVDQLEVTSVS